MGVPAESIDGLEGEIDRDSPVPYYFQLREIIRDEIINNRWRSGDLLPSERILGEAFGLSRPTVRDALESLVVDGLLRREKGVGTFVAEPRFRERWSESVIGLSDSLQTQGLRLTTKVLHLGVSTPDARTREELFLGSDDEVIELKRLRFMGGDPVLVTVSYLPSSLYAGLLEVDFSNASLYQTLRSEYGTEIVRVRRSIEAIAASTEIAGLLGIAEGAPLSYIENTAYTHQDRPIEYYVAWRRGDRSRFELDYRVTSR